MLHGHYLQRHGRRYRFRMRLPKGMVNFNFPSELVVALRTDSFVLALKRARVLRVAVESLMIDLSGAMDRAEAERLVRVWVDESTRWWEANLADSGGCAFFDRQEVERMGEKPARELDDLLRVVADTMARPLIKTRIRRALSGRRRLHAELEPIVASALDRIAPGIDRSSLNGKLLTRTVLRGLATIVDEQSAIERGDILPLPPAAAIVPSPPRPALAASVTFPFLACWDAFEASKLKEGEWKRDTATNARSARNLFGGLFGDVDVSMVTRQTAGEFRALLFGLPSGYDKARRWRGKNLREVIASAARGSANPAERGGNGLRRSATAPVQFLKVPTVNKHFSNLAEYWSWLQKTGRVGKDRDNPFAGFIVARPKGRRARQERDAWPPELLTHLFTSPVWTGCASLARRSKPGPHIYRDARFWVPLIGRMTGAREDEICSLEVGDIRIVDRIAVFHIADSKTDGSTRDVPLPELLLLMGFLEYRFYGRSAGEPLFPELLPQGVQGRRSPSFSSWFTEYRRAVGCYRPRVDFHSFRHTVSTELQNLPGLNPGWADEITGHESAIRASERSRYSKGVYTRHLKETLDRIEFGVNLDRLAYDGEFGVRAPRAVAEIAVFTERAVRDLAVKAGRREPAAPGDSATPP